MTRIELAPELLEDLDRVFDHVAEFSSPQAAAERAQFILDSLKVLALSPEIGRPLRRGLRELVIGKGSKGYLVLYRYLPGPDVVAVLALRSQRERDYRS